MTDSQKKKRCSKCSRVKPIEEFYKHKRTKDRRYAHCKRCHNKINSAWRWRNLERSKEHGRRYHANHPDAARRIWLKSQYGVTMEDFEALLLQQGGCCAICGGPAKNLDHCHKTNKVRGILCHNCNIGLGNFRDNPKLLLAAGAYIIRHLKAKN